MKTFLLTMMVAALVGVQSTRAEDAETSPAPEAPAALAADAPVIQADDLASLEGKVGSDVVIEGVVQSVGTGPNDGITFINFGERRGGFVAVVFRPSYDKFPDGFEKYAREKVRIHGRLEKYRDRQLQVRLSTPDQIAILESAPAATE
jgi:DNA/RNA endonuclease YhcR with UshA esterase domain